jgi:hypothetical protein
MGNTAVERDGGILTNASTATLTNVTLAGNASGALNGGGGINHNSAYGQTMTLKNTIIANNPRGGNCQADSGELVGTSETNLSSDDSRCPAQRNQFIALDPLASNGGPTLTQLSQVGSLAIDRGADCPATDQRGVADHKVEGATSARWKSRYRCSSNDRLYKATKTSRSAGVKWRRIRRAVLVIVLIVALSNQKKQ